MNISDHISRIRARFDELGERLSSEEVISNPNLLMKLAKERSDLEFKVAAFDKYESMIRQLAETRQLIENEEDPELVEMAEAEEESLQEELWELEEKIKIMLLPSDPMDSKNILMEIRAGTGGDEAALFAGELYRMYCHYADMKGWKTEIMSSSPAEVGGFKEVIFSIAGSDVFSQLKYESGVHRVQRVPVTESSGRIHTSAASVVVMPEAEDINVNINPNDLKVDVYRSSGPGGQSVNTTDSAVRITHLPTGLVVSCQDEKSQLKNKNKAMKVLKTRLLDKELAKQASSRSQARKSIIGSGDRSQKIRTYNFPQGRVTDHRINLTIHRLEAILGGDIDEIVSALRFEDQKHALEEQSKISAVPEKL